MALLDAGRNIIAQFIIAEAATAFNNANAHLGVGSGNAAFNKTHTDLQGASKTRKAMDATFPSRATNVLTFQSTFGTGEGNHAWEEWGIFNASSAGTMLNRKVVALGTKTSAQSWELNVQITVNNP